MNITYKGTEYRADHVILAGDMIGFGVGRVPSQVGYVTGVRRRDPGFTTDKAFGVVGRRMSTGPVWKRVRKPSVSLQIAFFDAERDVRMGRGASAVRTMDAGEARLLARIAADTAAKR